MCAHKCVCIGVYEYILTLYYAFEDILLLCGHMVHTLENSHLSSI